MNVNLGHLASEGMRELRALSDHPDLAVDCGEWSLPVLHEAMMSRLDALSRQHGFADWDAAYEAISRTTSPRWAYFNLPRRGAVL